MEGLEARFTAALDLHRRGHVAEAAQIYRELLGVVPGHADVSNLLGLALLHLGRTDEAGPLLQAAVAAEPSRAAFRLNLANLLSHSGDQPAALAQLRCALAIEPALPEAWFNTAHTCRKLRRLDEAIGGYRRGLAVAPNDAAAQASLGGSLYEGGQGRAAVSAFRRSLALCREPIANSGYLYVLEFDATTTPETHQRERRRWAHAHMPAAGTPAEPATRDPDRPITIGFFAPSFDSAAPMMIEPFLRGHDSRDFRVVLYSGLPAQDDLGRLFARLAERWRTVGGLDDRAFGLAIREDRIDILVDTANHIGGHRLQVFAGRHAPIQVSGWCHGLGTGTKAFDYVIGDATLIPEDERRLFVERVFDVPCRTAFPPPTESPPVSPPPVTLGRPFTFGHLGRLSKVTDETARLWHRLLLRAPGTRLLLKADRETAALGTRRVVDLLSADIHPGRIVTIGPKSRFDNMADYANIDLALDPTPVAGPLTVWESLWMGVPPLVMRGSLGARPSMSFLTATGLTHFIAQDEETYLRVALDLAQDPRPLLRLRYELRERLAASEAGNPEHIADAMSRAFRTMWRTYCTPPSPSHP